MDELERVRKMYIEVLNTNSHWDGLIELWKQRKKNQRGTIEAIKAIES